MCRMFRRITAVCIVSILGVAAAAAAQSSPRTSDTYTWPGEFVSLDTTAMTMTVKPRVAYPEAVSERNQFKAGEPVWVVWSGMHDYSDAVRQIRRAATGRKIEEDLVMPAELVSAEAANQQITIRVKVPASTPANIKALKPGDWVTVTSRHRPSTDADAVVTVRPYGATASASTSTGTN